MKLTPLVVLTLWGMAAVCNQQETINVNSRYTVEKIEIKVTGAKDCCKPSDGLRQDLVKLVGQKFNQEAITALSKKIRQEMKTDEVAQKLTRGEIPDHVVVTLEAASSNKTSSFGFSGSNVGDQIYHSRQGWSAGGEIGLKTSVLPAQTLAFGIVDNGVELTERYAGITSRYELQPFAVKKQISTTIITAMAGAPPAPAPPATPPGGYSSVTTSTSRTVRPNASESATTTTTTTTSVTTTTITGNTTTTSIVTGNTTTTTTTTAGKGVPAEDRLKLGFLFGSYHIQWNPATLAAAGNTGRLSEIYRVREDFRPTVKIKPKPSVEVTVGASFERLEKQFPYGHDAANAVTASVSYNRELGDAKTTKWDLNAGYDLRAATRVFASDYVYARHVWSAGVTESWGNSSLSTQLGIGVISGKAPLYERYSLGNDTTLRGWNKFDLDPLGGDRMVHSETEYKYHMVKVFYDTGGVWGKGETAVARNSAGIALQSFGKIPWKFLPTLAVAFPIRSGRVEPVFMVII